MIDYTGTYTDLYQLTMAQVHFLNGQNKRAIFDYFFRKIPFNNGYAVFAGLEDMLNAVSKLRFTEAEIQFLKQQGFHPDFLEYLKTFSFKGNIYSVSEGELVFPTTPILTVEASIIEAQILETLILNILNFQSLIATKARRIRQVAGENATLIDFGLRRAQSTGGYYASRAAVIGGFDATSNVRAACDYHLNVSGTMSHAFVQSYDHELDAFRDFVKIWPENSVLLVDTYNTLKSGVPNAIQVAHELRARGEELKGIRLDSGNLADLALQARKMMDAEGLFGVKIAVSNQLDEFAISILKEQNAPIDIYGVGTNLVIGHPDAALDGVYKLAYANGQPRIKLSETKTKTTLPGKKQVFRLIENEQFAGIDVITCYDEKPVDKIYEPFETDTLLSLSFNDYEPLLQPVMQGGKKTRPIKKLSEICEFSKKRLSYLPEHLKILKPEQTYQIGISRALKEMKDNLVEAHQVG